MEIYSKHCLYPRFFMTMTIRDRFSDLPTGNSRNDRTGALLQRYVGALFIP